MYEYAGLPGPILPGRYDLWGLGPLLSALRPKYFLHYLLTTVTADGELSRAQAMLAWRLFSGMRAGSRGLATVWWWFK